MEFILLPSEGKEERKTKWLPTQLHRRSERESCTFDNSTCPGKAVAPEALTAEANAASSIGYSLNSARVPEAGRELSFRSGDKGV